MREQKRGSHEAYSCGLLLSTGRGKSSRKRAVMHDCTNRREIRLYASTPGERLITNASRDLGCARNGGAPTLFGELSKFPARCPVRRPPRVACSRNAPGNWPTPVFLAFMCAYGDYVLRSFSDVTRRVA